MKIVKWLRTDVKMQKSHLWIIGLGLVIGLGFFINCAVTPFYPCNPVDYEQLILSASIIAGLGTARQVLLYKFKYLKDLKPPKDAHKVLAEDILREKLWVPFVGWCLVIGFAINMLLLPFFTGKIRPIEWEFLQVSIAIFLTISGTREVGIYRQIDESHKEMEQQQTVADKI